MAVAALIACSSVEPASPARSTTLDGAGASRGVLPPTATSVPLFADRDVADPMDALPSPVLVGITGWINSAPVELQELADRDRVVLLDFWTYTCVNCVRTFPFLRQMHERYANHGLTIIGVHSPEFDFEKDLSNVEAAVGAAGLAYPIAIDSDKATWAAFGNHFWPTSYLLDHNGDVIYRHFGEGGYADTETRIRQALVAAGADLSAVPSGGDFTPSVAENAHTQTREIYAGYRLGYESGGLFAAQDAYYLAPDAVTEYSDAGLRRHGQFELDGLWLNESDAIVAKEANAYVALPFLATTVNGVLSVESGMAEFVVELDGGPVPQSHAGADIEYDADGRSLLRVVEPRMYRIIESDEFRLYDLKLTASAKGLQVHNLTFGVFTEGP